MHGLQHSHQIVQLPLEAPERASYVPLPVTFVVVMPPVWGACL